VLSQPQQIIFFRDHLFDFPLSYFRPLGNPTRYIQTILNLFSRAKDEDVSPEEYLSYAYKLEEESKKNPENKELKEIAIREKEIAQTYQKYQELLLQEGKIDFGDQINLVLKLFREHPAIRKKYQKQFRYILVDEFQDTNYAQFELIKLLASPPYNLTVTGDDDQSIYKFRGAALSNIMSFIDTYPQAKQIVLTENYRNTQKILDTSYRLIKYNNPDRLEVKNNIKKYLQAQTKGRTKVKHTCYDTLSTEADKVAKLIKKRRKEAGYSYRDFAILVRSNNDADSFLRSLNMEDIPWQFSGNKGLYSREEIRVLISFLKVLTDLNDSMSLYYLASSEIYKFPAKELTLCMNYATRRNKTLFFVLSHFEEIEGLKEELSEEAKKLIPRIIKDLENYLNLSLRCSTGEVLYKFIMNSGYFNSLTTPVSEKNEKKVQNIAKFFDIIRSTSNVLTYNRAPQFIKYLDLLIQAGDDPAVAEADMDTEAVNVLTVHKAKGLEFPVVIMVDLVSDRFPTRLHSESISLPDYFLKEKESWLPAGNSHLQEERRLFYVGMTRAKKELYLISARDYGGKRAKKVSQFVPEALDLPKINLAVSRASALEVIKRSAPKLKGEEEINREISEDKMLTLSHYKIDDYLTCPLKYKYVHILRVPVIKHHAVIYGKALHDAVQRYYYYKLRGKKVKEEELISVFENSWSSEGFESREHEEERLSEGKRALHQFYQRAEKEKSLPSFIEKEFSFSLDNNRIIGRWDRVDIKDGKVTIIDFKSSDISEKDKADKKTKESLQLSIYALAYKEIYDKIPDKVKLHFLGSGLVGEAKPTEKNFLKTVEKIRKAAQGIRNNNYKATPGYMACRYCVFRHICPHTES
ncbi:MAG: ATP-dependent DNA helicase, partial [Candidatus Aerophobetes bacterium]|nr:ATP-dependent DNA helicase [Candidatus Aerophobetes bacterium]